MKKYIGIMIGIVLCVSLCTFAFVKHNERVDINHDRLVAAKKKVNDEKKADLERISVIDKELEVELPKKEAALKYCRTHDTKGAEANLKCVNSAVKKYANVSELENEKAALEKKEYEVEYKKLNDSKYNYLYYIGGGILIISILTSLVIFKRKNI